MYNAHDDLLDVHTLVLITLLNIGGDLVSSNTKFLAQRGSSHQLILAVIRGTWLAISSLRERDLCFQ